MKLLKSKIFWVNVVTFLIALFALLTGTFPIYAVYFVLGGQVLTIILRQLQGKVVEIGGVIIRL